MIKPEDLLAKLPEELVEALLKSYRKIIVNFAEHRWEPAELNGGKFCEVVYTVINGALSGKYPTKPTIPKNMRDSCLALEQLPADNTRVGDRSLRILIPRSLIVLYEIRNNRGVGHIGGDVDPNFLDATTVQSMASWVLAELIRIFHNVSADAAQEIVDSLIERKHPLVWQLEGMKRVQAPKMGKVDQSLLLLYSEQGWVDERKLLEWVEYSSLSMFIKRVLSKLHEKRLIEYDGVEGRVHLSPLGVRDVEERILPEYRVEI